MTVRLWDRVCRESEGGGAAPPAAGPAAPAPAPAAAPTGGTQLAADLRAEVAAERLGRRQAEEARLAIQQQHDAAVAAHAAALEAARVAAVTPLQTRLQRLEEQTIELALRAEAASAGLQDPDLLGLRTRMPDAPAVTVDESGVVTGARELIERFRAWKPDYFRAAAAPAPGAQQSPPRTPATPPPSPGARPGAVTSVKNMSAAEYSEFKRQQMRALRSA